MSTSETVLPAGLEARYRVSGGRCQACGAIFPPAPRRGPTRRWCSERCRWQGRKAALLTAERGRIERDREIRVLLEAALTKLQEGGP